MVRLSSWVLIRTGEGTGTTFLSHLSCVHLSVQDKPSVVSLTNLIVRDMANQDRGMYLISDSSPPEMYEVYASSKDDRKTWMSLIQKTAQR